MTVSNEMTKKIERQDQAINLARSIASDILIYNREAVEQGLRADDLFERLADEIDEGRRLYVERVSEVLPDRTNHFDRALGDILVRKGWQAIIGG